jgi:hypothetical protein
MKIFLYSFRKIIKQMDLSVKIQKNLNSLNLIKMDNILFDFFYMIIVHGCFRILEWLLLLYND